MISVMMAHKTATDSRRNRMRIREDVKMLDCRVKDSKDDDGAEIKDRFVDVDETDRVYSKVHVLKTRCSSEQNLIMKTTPLRKLSATHGSHLSLFNKKADSDKLNNNNSTNITKSAECLNEKEEPKVDVNGFKKNSNVYNVFQAKTVLKERRRSLPTLPKLISQKLHEHNQKTISKSADNAETVSALTKDLRDKTFRTLSKGLGRLLRRHSSVNISEPDPVFKVAYLGNVLTGWAKGEGCVDKPLSTLWRNYNQSSKPDVVMKLSITNSGLKAITKEHGLTEYWAHRITFCTSPPEFPKIFCWVYRHEGRKLKHELRCHAVLCSKESVSKRITTDLQNKIHQALVEFKKDKIARQNARLSLANCIYDNPSLPRRKILLSVGGNNYKPPLERSKSAPKLMAIEEMVSEEDEEEEEITVANTNKNTWTKDSSAMKMCCKADDIFPSYSLGRRKCDHFRKISLPETKSQMQETILHRYQSYDIDISSNNINCDENNVKNVNVDNSEYDASVTCEYENVLLTDESKETPTKRSGSLTNHVSFSFSNLSESCDQGLPDSNTDIEDNEVFYCESDYVKNEENSQQDQQRKTVDSEKSILEQLCNQANYLVLDSDEGSISSGCETASTVTSSDIEMTSLPCNVMQQEYSESVEKVSVLERVQSFEQLFLRERNSSLRSSAASSCSKQVKNSTNNEITSSSPSDSACYSSSGDTGPPSCESEVSLVPLGEKYSSFHPGSTKISYLRCSTFPPDDAISENISDADSAIHSVIEVSKNHDFALNYEGEVDRGDSDSACSVESGYSELLESGNHGDCLIGNTVMV